jgi:RNA polymerase sigma factor (sigma-70 family)
MFEPSPKPDATRSSVTSFAKEDEGLTGHAQACVTGSADLLFRQLVHDHQKRLYRFIVKNIGHGTDAEELTQQAFVEAAKGFETFRGGSELSTWLYGIAMNLVRNHLSRAPHRRYSFEDASVLDDSLCERPGPSEQLAQTQAVQRLQSEIEELPSEMRDVLLLVSLDELSYEEAAVMLSIPVGTVRSRVSRARSTLRKRMGDLSLPF